jgi:DNA-3-methyladenine glycosylase I
VRLYEKLPRGFQSGLSWITILAREAFRRAFKGFDPTKVARFGEKDVQRLLGDATIVRHRGKIEATIANAKATLALQRDLGSLAALVWSFEPKRRAAPSSFADVPASTPESTALSKELLRRGFRFVGPTTCYAAMQSLGIVDDHMKGATRARRAKTSGAPSLALSESLGRCVSERGSALRDFVHTHVRVDPDLLGVFIDLALTDDEARVQPEVRLALGEHLDAREDRPAQPIAGDLLDALPVQRDDDVGTVLGPDRAGHVRSPDAARRAVRPPEDALQHAARHRAASQPKPARSPPGDPGASVLYRQSAQRSSLVTDRPCDDAR